MLERALGVPMDRAIALSQRPALPHRRRPGRQRRLDRQRAQPLLPAAARTAARSTASQVFEPRTIRRAVAGALLPRVRPHARPAAALRAWASCSAASSLSLYGPDTEAAFGHLGFTNIISWADPERQIAGALMTSGKPLVYPGALLPARPDVDDRDGVHQDQAPRRANSCPYAYSFTYSYPSE